MKFDKIIRNLVIIAILCFLFISNIPNIVSILDDASKELDDLSGVYYDDIVDTYIKSRPDYYFAYEGATYCIPVSNLIQEGKLREKDVIQYKDYIIEAKYSNDKYTYTYNNNCEEK